LNTKPRGTQGIAADLETGPNGSERLCREQAITATVTAKSPISSRVACISTRLIGHNQITGQYSNRSLKLPQQARVLILAATARASGR
jgi:hypothetical protein